MRPEIGLLDDHGVEAGAVAVGIHLLENLVLGLVPFPHLGRRHDHLDLTEAELLRGISAFQKSDDSQGLSTSQPSLYAVLPWSSWFKVLATS